MKGSARYRAGMCGGHNGRPLAKVTNNTDAPQTSPHKKALPADADRALV